MWDEWSSPGELIHPGDLPSIGRITSSEGELDFCYCSNGGQGRSARDRDEGNSLVRPSRDPRADTGLGHLWTVRT